MSKKSLQAAIAAAFCFAAVAACHQDAGNTTVGQQVDKTLDAAKDKLADASRKTEQKINEVGDKAREEVAAVGAKVDDAVSSDTAITASIKTDFLKDPDLSVLKIDVDTRSGVVTLNGLTSNEAARSRAEKMASAVKGVKEVRNYLVIKHA